MVALVSHGTDNHNNQYGAAKGLFQPSDSYLHKPPYSALYQQHGTLPRTLSPDKKSSMFGQV